MSRMKECPQDPRFHAEGSVYAHTRMVQKDLDNMLSKLEINPSDMALLRFAALYHDVGKTVTTKIEDDGTITSKKHSMRGALIFRKNFYKYGMKRQFRETVCNLIRFHMRPFHVLEHDPIKSVAEMSLSINLEYLSLLAEADAKGRICDNMSESLEAVQLFRILCQDQCCANSPYKFHSDHERYMYFNHGKPIDSQIYDDTRCTVTLMSGLPGSGKDHWIKHNTDLPVISLDDIRQKLKIHVSDQQGEVIAEAQNQAKKFLAAKQDFVWNATNISKFVRSDCCQLFSKYNAKIRIISIDTHYDRLIKQNNNRDDKVPESVMEHLLDQWEFPSLTEAHEIVHVDNEIEQ